ncbi:MAG: hypothetical protein JWM44_2669 [Bacilli bacterium]|nr:hypothetical protein [Bacilli bacterium]
MKVKLTSQYAKTLYDRRSDSEILEISIETDTSSIKSQFSIPEAELLIKDLQELIHEIKD